MPREALIIGAIAAGRVWGAGSWACPAVRAGLSCLPARRFGTSGQFRAGWRPGYPVVAGVVSRVWITVALASMSRFAEAMATWTRFRFLASPR